MNKIFFFDVDGTIIDHSNNNVSQKTIDSIRYLKEQGHIIALATGKPPHLIEGLLKRLDICNYIAFNGNYVVVNHEVIFHNPIKYNEVLECASIYDKYGINVAFECVDGIYTLKQNDYMTKLAFDYYHLEYPIYAPKYHLENEVYQCLLMTSEVNDEIQNTIPGLQAIRSNPYLFDVMPKGGLKEAGMKKMLDYLNMDVKDSVAFGDGYNDIGMISEAGLGIAMGQGNYDLKKVSDYITKSVTEEGIYYALKEFKFI